MHAAPGPGTARNPVTPLRNGSAEGKYTFLTSQEGRNDKLNLLMAIADTFLGRSRGGGGDVGGYTNWFL